MEKVYLVEFMTYTDYEHNTVADYNKPIGQGQYLMVGRDGFLVRESELEKYSHYGDGYRSIKCVGRMRFD